MVQDSKILDVAFNPQSIAVIGASSDDNAEKKSWVGRLLEFGYKGKIYPINLKAPTVLGLKAYPSVKAVPEPIDYVIISIKSSLVPMALRDCITKGIKIAHILPPGLPRPEWKKGKSSSRKSSVLSKRAKSGLSGRTAWVSIIR